MTIEMHMHQLIANQKQNKYYNVPTMKECKMKVGFDIKKEADEMVQ